MTIPTENSFCKTCKNTLPIDSFRMVFMISYNKEYPVSECKKCEIYRMERRRNTVSRISSKIRINVVKIMGGKCTCCGITEWWNLCLDHIIPIKELKKLRETNLFREILRNPKLRKEYQLHCWGCNMSKMTGDKCIIDHSNTF